MDNELFMNVDVSHQPEITSLSSSPAMFNWVSAEESHPVETSLGGRDCFFWEKSTEQSIFDSALSSLVSSPTPSSSNFSGGGGGNNSVIRELIGKLGTVGEIYEAPASIGNVSRSCYGTPMSSPPPRPIPATTPLAEFSGDPGFAERAARFSCFGSRSFNGRTNSPLPINTGPVAATTNGKLTRVSSSPSLKAAASQPPAAAAAGELSRKRKAKSKEKSPSPDMSKEDSDPKRIKKIRRKCREGENR